MVREVAFKVGYLQRSEDSFKMMLGSLLQPSIIQCDFKTEFLLIFPSVWSQYLPSHCFHHFPWFPWGTAFLFRYCILCVSIKFYTLLRVIRVYQISALLGFSSTKMQCSLESVIWTAALWKPVCTELHLTLTAFLMWNGSLLWCRSKQQWFPLRTLCFFHCVTSHEVNCVLLGKQFQGDVLTCALPIKSVQTRIWVSLHCGIFWFNLL